MDCTHQAPLSMGFSKQGYRRGLPFPPPGDLPHPGTKSMSPALAGKFLTTEPPERPNLRCADDTTLTAESEEERKSLLMRVKKVRCHKRHPQEISQWIGKRGQRSPWWLLLEEIKVLSEGAEIPMMALTGGNKSTFLLMTLYPDAGKDWRREKKGTTEDEMVGWHHRLNGHEFKSTLGGLACCSPWGCKESDTTERLNWTALVTLPRTLPKQTSLTSPKSSPTQSLWISHSSSLNKMLQRA